MRTRTVFGISILPLALFCVLTSLIFGCSPKSSNTTSSGEDIGSTLTTVAGYAYSVTGLLDDEDGLISTPKARFRTIHSLAYDGSGSVYLADVNSGGSFYAKLRKYTISNGNVVTINVNQPLGFSAGLVVVGNYLYWADGVNCVIWKISLSDYSATILSGPPVGTATPCTYVDGAAGVARMQFRNSTSYTQLTSDGSTYLYFADANNHALRRASLADGSVTTLAGSMPPVAASGSANDPVGANARFFYPYSVSYVGGATPRVIVGDGCNSWFRTFTIGTGATTTLVGTAGVGFVDGAAGVARVASCATRASTYSSVTGLIYFLDNGAIRTLDPTTGAIATVAGATPPTAATGFADGTGSAARIQGAYTGMGSLTTDGTYLYFAEYSSNLRRMHLTTYAVDTLQGPEANYYGYNTAPTPNIVIDGVGTAARFNALRGMVYDGSRYVYIAESSGNLRRLDRTNWEVTTVAGNTPSRSTGYTDGVGTASRIGGAINYSLVYLNDIVYFADRSNCAIRTYNTTTGTVTTIAGSMPPTASCAAVVDGIGSVARFNGPTALTYYNGLLYVADSLNYRIRSINLTDGNYTVTTLAGSTQGFTDGVGGAAQLGTVMGLATGPDGKIYISDNGNHAIRSFDPATNTITTVAGAYPTATRDYIDGTGTSARLYSPYNLFWNPYRSQFQVVDYGNCALRNFSYTSGNVTTFLGATWNTQFATNCTQNDGRFSAATLEPHFGGVVLDAQTILLSTFYSIRKLSFTR